MKRLITIGLVVLLLGLVLSVPLKVNALQDEKSIVEGKIEMPVYTQSTSEFVHNILELPAFSETIFLLSIPILWIFLLIREIIYISYHLFLAMYAEFRLMIIKQWAK